MAKTKVLFGLLTFVTIGMIIGALLQLIFIRRLEESSGIPHWANDNDADDLRLGLVRPEIISWSPRIIVLHNFLSMEECDYLRAIARPRLQVSTVVDVKTGKGIKSDVRTSSGMFLSSEERKYPLVKAIEKRISVFSQIPVENGELIQVLRYEKNQFYRPHHDYFADTFNLKRGGQRIATMLMYLSDNVVGGETYFPMAGDGECSCGGKMVKGMCVKPTKGDAVLFWSMASNLVDIVQVGGSSQHQHPWLGSGNEHSGSLNSGLLLYRMLAQEESPIPWSCHASPLKKCIATYCRLYDRLICFQGLDGATDQYSIHGGCEVLEGEKWSATKWMRQRTTI